ncbi:MAG TPA: hypothetical protein VIT65_24125 [Microlunatus sp.]
MFWIIVFGAIALGGLAMVICFGVSLWRKSQALLGEVGVLLERADEFVELLDRLEVSPDRETPARYRRETGGDEAEIEDVEMGLSR